MAGLWLLVNPALTAVILVVVFGQIVRLDVPQYWAFLISGYVAWVFALHTPSTSVFVIPEHASMARSVAVRSETAAVDLWVASIRHAWSMQAVVGYSTILPGGCTGYNQTQSMARPVKLSRPPITEFLIDIQAEMPHEADALRKFADRFRSSFPKQTEIRRLTLQMAAGVPQPLMPPSFHGMRLESHDGKRVAQFRPDGFTFNNLIEYLGQQTLLDEAMNLWAAFAGEFGITSLARVGVRALNRLELPLHEGDDLEWYLMYAPRIPDGVPEMMSEFVCRTVTHDKEFFVNLAITQRLTAGPTVLIDVDVFRTRSLPVEAQELKKIISSLMIYEQTAFFALLTERTVDLYR